MTDLAIFRITTAPEMDEALAIRRAVFVQEQNVPVEIEIDEHDGDPNLVSTALHVLGRSDGLPVATGRLLLATETSHAAEGSRKAAEQSRKASEESMKTPLRGLHAAHVGRVAVLAAHRRQGWGGAVMSALQQLARDQGYSTILLSAQLHAMAFYEQLGYEAHGDVFLEAGIEHRQMALTL